MALPRKAAKAWRDKATITASCGWMELDLMARVSWKIQVHEKNEMHIRRAPSAFGLVSERISATETNVRGGRKRNE
jgi:hypothetical protein